jgi:hypothetical protein
VKKWLTTAVIGAALLTQTGCDEIEIEIDDGFFGGGHRHGYFEPVYYEEVWYEDYWFDSFFWF